MSTVRLTEEMRERVRQVAALKGVTVSEVHRLALERYLEQELAATRPSRYDDDIIGVADGGPADLATRASEYFTECVVQR